MDDFCSALDLEPEAKYTGTIERVARALPPPRRILRSSFQCVLFAWLIADGDMHLKNMALLKTAMEGDRTFRTVRIAPVYDTLTTRVFPGLEHDRMALKMNGKDERLRRADFVAFATLAGMRAADANAVLDGLLHRLKGALATIQVPTKFMEEPGTSALVAKTLDHCDGRIAAFD